MASNSFGNIFKITTWGESHGKAIGVVIDGCPAGLPIDENDINEALSHRTPGRNPYTSPRSEKDQAEILSGIFEGKTTGSPISIIIPNRDVDSSKYHPIKDMLRPGHANYTYLEKYGVFDYRGGGRASARETACRVAAGAIAQKLLTHFGIDITAYVKQIGHLQAEVSLDNIHTLKEGTLKSPIFCPDEKSSKEMMDFINEIKSQGNSVGGAVAFLATGLPVGLGDPIYAKLEASLANAMLSLPATKGFEIGKGFEVTAMTGALHNDNFINDGNKIQTQTNNAGGTLAGISNGMPLLGKVAFKPTSSIMQQQETVTTSGQATSFVLPEGSRHDPCVAIRAVPVVEAMVALVLVDALLLQRCVKL